MLSQETLRKLRQIVNDRLSTDIVELKKHGGGCFYISDYPPEAVLWPGTTEEISRILILCNDNNIPVIPYGSGTGVEGHTAAPHGGICIDMSKMNHLLECAKNDFYVRVQAGATHVELNQALKDQDVFFPVDAALNATIGGMVATGASGTNAVRYGTMRENVIGLTVVKADGTIIKTGGKTRKSSAGYDLTRLLIGSEGTLGIVTEVTLKVYPIPKVIKSAVCQFDHLEDATNTAIQTMQAGVNVGRIELLDNIQMGACIKYSSLTNLNPKHTLLFEFQGNPAAVQEEIEITHQIAQNNHCCSFNFLATHEEHQAIWLARKNACYAALALSSDTKAMATDVCVPISRLSEAVIFCAEKAREFGFTAPIVGHVGDGNFHLTILVEQNNKTQMKQAVALNECIMQKALSLEGTITGEHGIGLGKMHFLENEHGDCLQTYRELKKALDPKNILNPGKIFDPDFQTVLIKHGDLDLDMNTFRKFLQLGKKADEFGFSWPDSARIIKQIVSECAEIQENIKNKGTSVHLQEEIGDLIHGAFSLCIFNGFDPEETLAKSLIKFESRLNEVIHLANEAGYDKLHGETFNKFMLFWEQAKKNLMEVEN